MGVGDVRLLSVRQVANQLNVHPETVRKWYRQGKLEGHHDRLRPGGPLMFEQQTVIAFAKAMREG